MRIKPQQVIETLHKLTNGDAYVASDVGQHQMFAAPKLSASRSAARRTIEQGGAYINNSRINDSGYRITRADLAGRELLVLRSGKKSYAVARFSQSTS